MEAIIKDPKEEFDKLNEKYAQEFQASLDNIKGTSINSKLDPQVAEALKTLSL